MSAYNETSNWRTNTLRVYESIGSIGAKYCYLNKVKPKEFYNLIIELIGDKREHIDRDDYTFDNLEFDFSMLSKLLAEPLSTVNKLSLNAITHLPNLHKQTGYSLASKKNLAYCPVCLANGYHSPLHQIHWVTNCFIHNETLINVTNINQSISKLHGDIKLLGHLYDIWFVQSKVWDSANSFEWLLIDNKLIEAKAKLFISALINTENLITKESKIIGNNIESNLLLQVENTGNLNSVFQIMHQNKRMSFGEPINFTCSPAVADYLLGISNKEFNLFMYARQVTSGEDNVPQWKEILGNLYSVLKKNHSHCLFEYKKSFESLEKLRIKWCSQHGYVHPPYDMDSYERVPCQRIVTLNLLQVLLNIEDSLIHNTPSGYSDYRFKGKNYFFNDIEVLNDLINVDLARKWTGLIPLGQHEIMKKYTPGSLFNTNDEVESRHVTMHIPYGVLAEITDQLLLSLICSWVWALYETELNRNSFIDSKSQPAQYLKSMINKLAPSAIIQKTKNGVQLKIGTILPYTTPDWSMNRLSLINHCSEVQKKSKELEVIFDQVLVQKMERADLYQRSKNYILLYGH